MCPNCHNCQLSVSVDQKRCFLIIYIPHRSSHSRKHFEDAAKHYAKEFKLSPKKSYISDIGSNDGVALEPFKDLGLKIFGGRANKKSIKNLPNKNGIKTVKLFLSLKNLKNKKKRRRYSGFKCICSFR